MSPKMSLPTLTSNLCGMNGEICELMNLMSLECLAILCFEELHEMAWSP